MCISEIAPDTVDAVVPIAPAVIVPNSASSSLTEPVRVFATVVRVVCGLAPMSESSSTTAAVRSVAVRPPVAKSAATRLLEVPRTASSSSLIEPTKSESWFVVKLPVAPTSYEI